MEEYWQRVRLVAPNKLAGGCLVNQKLTRLRRGRRRRLKQYRLNLTAPGALQIGKNSQHGHRPDNQDHDDCGTLRNARRWP